MTKDLVPRADSAFATWVSNLTKLVALDPEKYGQSAESAGELVALEAVFAQAFRTSSAEGTRTKSAVAAKDQARRVVERVARQVAARARVEFSLSLADRTALGLTPPGRFARPSEPPELPPSVTVLESRGNCVTVMLRDPELPFRNARPDGVVNTLVFWAVQDREPAPGDRVWFVRQSNKMTVEVVLPADLPPGTKVWIAAEWLTYTNKRGRRSQAIHTYVTPVGGMKRRETIRRAA